MARRGLARHGRSRHGRLGLVRLGMAWYGMAWQARRGDSVWGRAWQGTVRLGVAGMARRVGVRPVPARRGRQGVAGLGKARRVAACHG